MLGGYEMDSGKKKRLRNLVWQAAKIGAGSSAAIYVASNLNLQFASSAGTIALLTLMTTRWETLKLSFYRILTFIICVALASLSFMHISSEWIAYGVYILIMVVFCEWMGWKATISVNAVIGTHFLSTHDFTPAFIANEFMLVLIGISIAIVLNLFHLNETNKKEMIRDMRYTEDKLQEILREIASYLNKEKMHHATSVWDEIDALENKLQTFIKDAHEYQENTFVSHPQYYIDYFEMRHQQLGMLHSLHHEMKRIRMVPEQAKIIAEYIIYMTDYVVEVNSPDIQLAKLQELFEEFKNHPLPKDHEEFEARAVLYHILMYIEDFLLYKKRFVDNLNENQLRRYWKQDKKEIEKEIEQENGAAN